MAQLTIKEFLNQNVLTVRDLENAKAGWDFYLHSINHPPICAWEYFRTQFNNFKKALAEGTIQPEQVVSSGPIVKELPLEIEKPNINFNTVVYEEVNNIVLPGLIPTGNIYDKIASDRYMVEEEINGEIVTQPGGYTRKCVDVIAGAPGSGKTSSTNHELARAAKYNRDVLGQPIKVGFISGEMFESEWAKEVKGCELLKEVEVCYFMEEFRKHHMNMTPEGFLVTLENVLKNFDIVTVDSFPVIMDLYRELDTKITEKAVTGMFINFYIEMAHKYNMNIQLINQANKDGNYKGGTLLPHMASSLSFVLKENGKRYKYFEKNRNNGNTIHQKLFFKKLENNEIVIDEETYNISYGLKRDEATLQDFLDLTSRKPEMISFEAEINGKNLPKSVEEVEMPAANAVEPFYPEDEENIGNEEDTIEEESHLISL